MHAGDSKLVFSRDGSGALVARTGVPLADAYLEFLGCRCRPNTVRAAAYDLKVFFSVVGRPPDQVRPADVLAFITAQRTGQAAGRGAVQPVKTRDEPGGVSAATVRRRLSIVSGFFAFLQARASSRPAIRRAFRRAAPCRIATLSDRATRRRAHGAADLVDPASDRLPA